MGEMLLSDTKFNSFADITNEYVGSLAGFITGWTYWLTWIISGMAEVTAVAKYVSFGFHKFPIGYRLFVRTPIDVFQFIEYTIIW